MPDTLLEKKGLRGRTPGKARRINNPLSLVKRKRALIDESHVKDFEYRARARAREGWKKLRNLVRVSLTFAWKTRNWLAHSNSGSGRDRDSFYGCVKPSAGLRARWIKPPFSFLPSRRTAASRPFLDPSSVASLSPPSWTRNNITDVATTVVETIPGKGRGIDDLFSVVEFNY